mgnify:FL=1
METTNVEPRGSNVDFVWTDEKAINESEKDKVDADVVQEETVLDTPISDLPKDEEEMSDEDEAIVDQIIEDEVRKTPMTKTEFDKSVREYIIKRAEESEIDWDSVEFAPDDTDKLFPVVTKEELETFLATMEIVFEPGVMDSFIDMAYNDIKSWASIKDQFGDFEGLDPEDLEYFESVSHAKDESRIMLATVQIEGRKLLKSFKEDKVAETLFRNVISMDLYRFITDYNWTYTEGEVKDITERIKKYTVPVVLFQEYINNHKKLYKKSTKNSWLSSDSFTRSYLNIVNAATSIIDVKNLKEITEFDISTILEKDLNSVNFYKVPIVYAIYLHDEEDLFGMKSTWAEEDIKTVENLLDKNKYISKNEGFDVFLEIYKDFKNIVDRINDNAGHFFKRLFTIIYLSLLEQDRKDKFYLFSTRNDKEYKVVSFDEYVDTFNKNSEALHDLQIQVNDRRDVTKWRKVYQYIQKIVRLSQIVDVHNKLNSDEYPIDDTKKRYSIIFGVVMDFVNTIFRSMYSDFLVNLRSFARNDYDRYSQTSLYKMYINTFILLFGLIYNTEFENDDTKETNISGKGLLGLAKKTFNVNYDFIVDENEETGVLAKVDLQEARRQLFEVVYDTLSQLDFETGTICVTKPEDLIENFGLVYEEPFVGRKKLSKAQRRKQKNRK